MRGWELDVESNIGVEGSQRFRSVCRCDAKEYPRRNSRGQAEDDLVAIRLTFAANGPFAAGHFAADMDRGAAASAQSNTARTESAQSKAARERPPGYFGQLGTAQPPVDPAHLLVASTHVALGAWGGRLGT